MGRPISVRRTAVVRPPPGDLSRSRRPRLTSRLNDVEREGIGSAAYRGAAIRATPIGIAVMVPVLGILFMMVVKPTL